jgi:DNA-binding NtrC family response regulator
MSKSPLSLVYFGIGRQCEQLQQALAQDWEPVHVTDGPSWLETGCASAGPLVLSLGEKAGRLAGNAGLLAKLRETPILAVVPRRGPFRLARLLEKCRDFVTWPCGQEELRLRIQRLCRTTASPFREEQSALADVASLNLIGRSPAFEQFLTRLRKAAACEAPVLIEGETGSGKELAARAIHYLGPRQDFPFIPVNCGAIPDDLIENELFGHESGAYTDAKGAQIGAVTQAHKGTLFLDEIESLSPKAQVVLLRFLQDQTFKPLGAQELGQVDVRVIAAGNQDLHGLVREGAFRQDLLFRLDVADLALPPLREREGDIALLAEHYLERYARKLGAPAKHIHPDTLAWMQGYRWPGNVRELENFIQKGLLASGDECIRVEDIDTRYLEASSLAAPQSPRFPLDMEFSRAKRLVVDQFEAHYLRHLLAESGGNASLAASKACKERSAFGRLLKKHGIDREQYAHAGARFLAGATSGASGGTEG